MTVQVLITQWKTNREINQVRLCGEENGTMPVTYRGNYPTGQSDCKINFRKTNHTNTLSDRKKVF